jgi:hypothetical protein
MSRIDPHLYKNHGKLGASEACRLRVLLEIGAEQMRTTRLGKPMAL